MKKFIPINQIVREIKRKGVTLWIDKLTFPHILLLWALVTFLFGMAYNYFTSETNFLFYTANKSAVSKAYDTIYFSFVTATSTGFGDITPIGIFKMIAILEVIFGLILLALVTSKLVSIKQDVILNEIYELSLNERVNRLRSSLLLFRQNLSRIISRVEEGAARKREIKEIYVYISAFEDVLNETSSLMEKPKNKHFTKRIDPVSAELIYNSIVQSFEKINEFIAVMNLNKIEWKRELTITFINRCIEINEILFEKLNSSKGLMEKTLADLNTRKKEAIIAIKKETSPEEKKEEQKQ